MRTLKGRTIGLLEARQSAELTAMVTRLGGTVVSAPALSERRADYDAEPVLRRLIADEFQVVVVLTGVGVSALFAKADDLGLADPVRAALARARIVCRGPKPQVALKRHDLSAAVVTAKPHTTAELLEAVASLDLDGVPLMLLHYGERNTALAEALVARGARLEDVCLYEWALPDDVTPIEGIIRRTIAGEIDALLFTSQVQFRFLCQIAERGQQADALLNALRTDVVVGAVGPVCAAALRQGGVVPDVIPASPNSASLVGAVAEYFELIGATEDLPSI